MIRTSIAVSKPRMAPRPATRRIIGLIGLLLAAADLGSTATSDAAEASGADNPLGVAAIAPRTQDLGGGWTASKIVFAVDPLDRPSESLNAEAGEDPSNRARLLQSVQEGLKQSGAAGIGYFAYGHGDLIQGRGRYDLYINRFKNVSELETYWSSWTNERRQRQAPVLGEGANWVGSDRGDRRLLIRQGLFVLQLECGEEQSEELLLGLARTALSRIPKPVQAKPGRE